MPKNKASGFVDFKRCESVFSLSALDRNSASRPTSDRDLQTVWLGDW